MNIDNTNRSTIIKSIDGIAKNLLLNKAIRINESMYGFIDVEIYYWHENHPDEYAKGVNHLKPKGEFEAHRYGVDLSLGNMKTAYGGILICGLYDFSNDAVLEKSKILRSMFNQLSIGGNSIELVDHNNSWTNAFTSVRLNLGKPDTDSKYEFITAPYKYLINDMTIFKSLRRKEDILRKSDLNSDQIYNLLGYNLLL